MMIEHTSLRMIWNLWSEGKKIKNINSYIFNFLIAYMNNYDVIHAA